MHKSPFFVVKQFISPLACEDIINRLNHTFPDENRHGQPIKTIKHNKLSEIRILPHIEDLVPKLEEYYGFELEGILPFNFEWLVEGCELQKPICENSAMIDGEWRKINDYDFTGIIFLNDYQSVVPFDNRFEVKGGKLQFLNHNFAFNPQRGTLVIFPSGPNFINHTTEVVAGELNQIRFHMVATTPYQYDMRKFPGTHKDWFK
jgi:hypothetical protein